MAKSKDFEVIQVTDNSTIGKNGFRILLDGDIARRALALEMPRESYLRLREEAREIVLARGYPDKSQSKSVYSFIRCFRSQNYTSLLQFCSTPGRNYDLTTKYPQIRNLIEKKPVEVLEYKTSAVNDANRADLLLALWQHWFNEMVKFGVSA